MAARPSDGSTDAHAATAAQRAARLRDWRILDTPAEAAFDDLAQLAALLCDTRWACVNLLDERRCWSKAHHAPGPREQPLDRSFCALALATSAVFVLPDTGVPAAGGRGDGRAGFYAAAVIRDADGLALGTVCVTDPQPRPAGLTPAQSDGLVRLARQAMVLIAGRNAEDYRLAFRHAAVDLVLIAVQDDGRFTLLDLNETHMANTGLRPDSFIGRTPEEALPPGTAAFGIAKYRECLRTGAVVSYEQIARFPSGDRLRRSFLTPLRTRDGRIDRILLTSIDRTEASSIQPQLRQSQKLAAMGQLAGGLAHDFNNLLAAIVGNLELLSERLADPALRNRVETALRAAERGGLLTQRLLDFGRPPQAVATGIDPNRAIGAMLDLLRRTLGGLVVVEAELAADLWPMAAEAAQLEQAVLNLAINARDAMPAGGTLTIRTANLPAGDPAAPGELPVGDFVIVSVTDQGSGMPPEVLERAIEPFFTTKPPGKGSGLGLAQVYSFARQFGGTVQIDSAVGQGTCVTLTLPRGTPVAEAPMRPPRPVSHRVQHAMRILVVDDDPDVRQAAVDVLASAGHVASGAASAAVALSLLAAGPVDLVLADHGMPGISGVDLLRQVHRAYPAIRTLLMTGNPDAVRQYADLAEDAVVRKPFSVKTLLQAIDTARAAPDG